MKIYRTNCDPMPPAEVIPIPEGFELVRSRHSHMVPKRMKTMAWHPEEKQWHPWYMDGRATFRELLDQGPYTVFVIKRAGY